MSWYVFTEDELDELNEQMATRLVQQGEFTEYDTLVVEPDGITHLQLNKDPVTIFEKPTGELLKL